jgi:hypothetical protein
LCYGHKYAGSNLSHENDGYKVIEYTNVDRLFPHFVDNNSAEELRVLIDKTFIGQEEAKTILITLRLIEDIIITYYDFYHERLPESWLNDSGFNFNIFDIYHDLENQNMDIEINVSYNKDKFKDEF